MDKASWYRASCTEDLSFGYPFSLQSGDERNTRIEQATQPSRQREVKSLLVIRRWVRQSVEPQEAAGATSPLPQRHHVTGQYGTECLFRVQVIRRFGFA